MAAATGTVVISQGGANFDSATFPRFVLGDGTNTLTFVIDNDARGLKLSGGGDASGYSAGSDLPLEDSQKTRLVVPTFDEADGAKQALLSWIPSNAGTAGVMGSWEDIDANAAGNSGLTAITTRPHYVLTDASGNTIKIGWGQASATSITNNNAVLIAKLQSNNSSTPRLFIYRETNSSDNYFIRVVSNGTNQWRTSIAFWSCIKHAYNNSLINIDARIATTSGTLEEPASVGNNAITSTEGRGVVMLAKTAGFAGNACNMMFLDPNNEVDSTFDEDASWGYDEYTNANTLGFGGAAFNRHNMGTPTNDQYWHKNEGSRIYFRQGTIAGSGSDASLSTENIAEAIKEMINASILGITATRSGSTVNLTNDTDGDSGNVTITTTNEGSLFTVSGMSNAGGGGGGGGGGGTDVARRNLISAGQLALSASGGIAREENHNVKTSLKLDLKDSLAALGTSPATTDLLAIADATTGIVKKMTVAELVGAVAGGTNTQIQFNQSGSLAGHAGFTFDPGEDVMIVPALTSSFGIRVVEDREATTTSDGSLSTAGGLSVAKSVVVGDDLDLLSDGAILNFGADKDITFTHDGGSGLDVVSAGDLDMGSTAGSMTLGSALADGQTLKIGKNGAVEMIFTPHGTPANEKISLTNTAGTADDAISLVATAGGVTVQAGDDSLVLDANGTDADALNIDSAGGIDVDAAGLISLDSSAGSIEVGPSLADGQTLKLGKNGATEMVFTPHGTAGNEKISLINTAGTADDAIKIDAEAGGLTLAAGNDSLILDADGTDADAINMDSAGGIDVDAAGLISVDSSAGSIEVGPSLADGQTLKLGKNGAVEMVFTPHGTPANEKVSLTNTAGTADDAISLVATAGGVTVQAGNDSLVLDADGTDADALKITSAGGMDVDVADEISLTTTSADGHISLVSAHTAGVALHIDADAAAGSIVDVDAGILDVDVTGVASIDSGGTLSLGTANSGVAVNIGHSTSEVTVGQNLTVVGNLTVSGDTTTVNTANLLVEDPVILLANGASSQDQNGGIVIEKGGSASDADMVFGRVAADTWGVGTKNTAGGTVTTLTDMTLAAIRASKIELGAAEEFISGDGTDISFTVGAGGDINIPANIGLTFGDDGEKIEGDGSALTIAGGALTLDSEADIVLDAGGADVIFKDDGVSIGTFTNASNDFVIASNVNDKDIIFKGEDNSSTITALTLDMSEAGDASFNRNVTVGGSITCSMGNMHLTASDATHFVLVQDSDFNIVKRTAYHDLISSSAGNGLQINASSKRVEIVHVEDHFVSTSANTGRTFTLSKVPASGEAVSLYINGIYQVQAKTGGLGSENGDYAVSGKTLTLVAANTIDSTDEVVAKYIEQ